MKKTNYICLLFLALLIFILASCAQPGAKENEWPEGDTKWHEVGTAGEPAFATSPSWSNYNPGGLDYETVAFIKDGYGYVHLKGTATGGTNLITDTIFNLPAGYRPDKFQTFPAITGNTSTNGLCYIGIQPVRNINNEVIDCYVNVNSLYTSFVFLDGIVFRAEH